MLIPPVVVGLCWRILFTPDLGGINYFIGLLGLGAPDWLSRGDTALLAVTVASLWEWSPFVMVVLLAGLESLPSSPVESACIDGASALQMVFYIVLPLLKPVLLTVTMLRIIEALGILPVVYMMTGGGPASATEAINLYAFEVGFSFLDIAYASSLLVLFTMLILVFSLGFLRKSLGRKA
jgi:ABC-type sugar transport system permease subunit